MAQVCATAHAGLAVSRAGTVPQRTLTNAQVDRRDLHYEI